MLLNGCASRMDHGAQAPRHGLRLPHAVPARTSATQAKPRIANPPRMRADAAVPSAAWLADRWPSRGRRALQSAPAASRPTRPTKPASTAPAARSAREATGSSADASPFPPSPHGSDHAGRPGPDPGPDPRDSLGGAGKALPSTTLAGVRSSRARVARSPNVHENGRWPLPSSRARLAGPVECGVQSTMNSLAPTVVDDRWGSALSAT